MGNKNSGGSAHLTKPVRITFLVAIGILSFIWSTGSLGTVGLLCGILAAALNIVVLLDAGSSMPWLVCVGAVNIAAYAAAVVYSHSYESMLTALYPIVMAAAVASVVCGDVTIEGSEAVNKSYPSFFEDFRRLGGIVVM